MSYAVIGGTTLPTNELNLVSIDVRHQLSRRNKRQYKDITFYLRGEIQTTGTALITAINARRATFDSDYQDFKYYLDDGTLAHSLINGDPNNLSGVKVLNVPFPQGDGAELATKRTYAAVLWARFASAETELLYWRERLRYIGNCGPRFEVVETYFGPVASVTALSTAQRVVQYGRAVGMSGYVLPPGPLFPSAEQQDRREVELTSGENQGLAAINFETEWQYHMISGTPLETVPTTR